MRKEMKRKTLAWALIALISLLPAAYVVFVVQPERQANADRIANLEAKYHESQAHVERLKAIYWEDEDAQCNDNPKFEWRPCELPSNWPPIEPEGCPSGSWSKFNPDTGNLECAHPPIKGQVLTLLPDGRIEWVDH